MSLRRLIIRLRVFVTLIVVVGIISGAGALVYLHEKGLTHASAERVAHEMERYGLFVSFDQLSFHVLNGLTANNVRFYRTEKREVQIAELPAIVIHVDKTKLMRGHLKINTISITNAQLAMPLVRGEADSPILNIKNVNGNIDLPGNQSLSTTGLTGMYEGIKVSISCNIWRDAPNEDFKPDPESKKSRVAAYKAFLEQLKQWDWPVDSPPELKIFVEGNLSNPSKVDFDYLLSSSSLTYKNYPMADIHVEGDWNQNLVTLDTFEFTHQAERCMLTADLDLLKKSGRFKLDSSIHLQDFALKGFGQKILQNFSAAGKNHIVASGNYLLPSSTNPKLNLQIIGKVSSSDFSFSGASVDKLDSEFSWNNGDLYLDKISVTHRRGKLSGRVIIKDRQIRYKIRSSLPAQVYFPFLKSERLKTELAKSAFDKNSYIDLHANGTINQDNVTDWQSHGNAEIRNFSYNGVPTSYAKVNYALNRETAEFKDITATFDYTNYPMRLAYKGPKSGTLTAKSLKFVWKDKNATIAGLRGSAWPAPVVRLFAPSIADHLETYKFHYPPTVSCSGVVSWAKMAANNMKLLVGFTSSGDTHYNFLKKDITLSNTKGQVTILPNKVQINSLSSKVCGGFMSGYLHVKPSDSSYSGRFQWDALKLRSISKTYGLKGMNEGSLTGSFTFRGMGSKVSSLNGHGNLALSNGNLFAVPIFGPLSSLVDSVVNPLSNQQVLHEQARNFSCNFSTKNGSFHTKDLTSMTASTTFTGEGWIDLNKEILDLTIRMNFRGMMGLAEIPMRIIELPFQALKTLLTGQEVKGLRQFRGTGEISKPIWQFTPFQPPRDDKGDPIFRKPPRAELVK
ncbi:MAG: AsmA-like C-terminal region-containing protein [Rubritalea sp.]|uniref:AsmA-like C-terminal region-containing protein n=1 Tax=Rubritalea sp. TaxID=2109375 RepID=UPI0032427CF3